MSVAGSGRLRREIPYGAAAVLAFLLLWTVTFQGGGKADERTEAEIVILGDSLLGQQRDETSVAAYLSEILGREVYNGAMGGTCMSAAERLDRRNFCMEMMNMVSLSRAIAAKDFRAQRTVRCRQPATEYFEDNISRLACIDYDSVKVLILEFGLNDYHTAVPVENKSDPTDESTYAGAVRSVVSALRKAYPDLRIVLVTPTYTWYVGMQLTCEEYDTGNGCLEGYADALIRTAEEVGAEAVDLYHDVYPHDTWEDWMIYTGDGVHPNEAGRRLIAEYIAEGL